MATDQSQPSESVSLRCGIIMPISEMPGGYTVGHWADVQRVIKSAAEKASFTCELVSNSDEVGIIHANIINNIYQNEMIICDVSGRNANVMFELGLRLASGKPVIIIKDEATAYTFDTAPIEYLEYRKDLRIFEMISFQERLAEKIQLTYKASQLPGYRTFLDHFGNYTLAKVENKTVELSDLLQRMDDRLAKIEQSNSKSSRYRQVNFSMRSGSETDPLLTLDPDALDAIRNTVQEDVDESYALYRPKSSQEIEELNLLLIEKLAQQYPELIENYGIGAFVVAIDKAYSFAVRRHSKRF